MFRYYVLGGDTAAPSGLNARLCYAFLVYLFLSSPGMLASQASLYVLPMFFLSFFLVDLSDKNIRIYWIDLH